MKKVKDVTKDMILAALGSIDEQNEEIKDLLRRGSVIFGMGEVDNEELLYNGNRDEITARRQMREKEDKTYDLGDGKTLYFNREKLEDGKITEIEFDKRKGQKEAKALDLEAKDTPDESKLSLKKVSQTLKEKKEGED
ncbi:MAG: hypothetical protein J5856_02300 [Lachnospiraceae bacterium]|nr:hypothetical protein [Lachnospiraceae bacterium]